jgi:hypothetical protein
MLEHYKKKMYLISFGVESRTGMKMFQRFSKGWSSSRQINIGCLGYRIEIWRQAFYRRVAVCLVTPPPSTPIDNPQIPSPTMQEFYLLAKRRKLFIPLRNLTSKADPRKISLFIFYSQSPIREPRPCSITGSPWAVILRH